MGACIDPHRYDAGKRIKGKKRHPLVDTLGLLLHAIVHPADIQDRNGGILLLSTLFGVFPFLQKLFADSAYQGPLFNADREDLSSPPNGNRQTFGSGQRVCGSPKTLDG
jgi:Transposase DDE domain